MKHTILATLFAFALASATAVAGPGGKSELKPTTQGWQTVDKLVNEQKYQAALDEAKGILNKAKNDKDPALWTEALIKCTQLQLGLSGFETAVRFLKEEPWPSDSMGKALLQLYYAQSLIDYHRAYAYEIREREKTNSKGPIDLKALTTEQLADEIRKAFDAAAADASTLNKPTPFFYKNYIIGSSYPVEVKPLLRDAIVDLATEHLIDTQFWSAEQSNEVFRLDFKKLAAAEYTKRIAAADPKAHPLEIAASWLSENAALHRGQSQAQAALESQYALLNQLHRATTEELDRKIIRHQLAKIQKSNRDNPWWSRGQALLADFAREESTSPERFIEALALAQEGARAYPKSIGAQMCESIAGQILQASYSLEGMQTDAANKASLVVSYRNLNKVYFRAYKKDLEAVLSGSGGQRWNNQESLRAKLRSNPVAQWSVDLPTTRDYALHRAHVTPKIDKPGFYDIFASANDRFDEKDNEVLATQFLISNLVLVNQAQNDGSHEIHVLRGASGKPESGVAVTLYRFTYDSAPENLKTKTTGEDGKVSFDMPAPVQGKYYQYLAVGKKGEHFAGDLNQLFFGKDDPAPPTKSTLLFTDRAIYRPGQKIQWKVAGYEGKRRAGEFHVLAKGSQISVSLGDPNGQIVTTQNVTTNEFGTAAGEFLIPSGRPLGYWSIRTNLGGSNNVRVEEYKRPTFEVELKEAKSPMRLNKNSIVAGQAKYYFGQPVSAGTVRWRVTREEVFPWWWEIWGWGWGRYSIGRLRGPQTIATGKAAIKSDGTFQIEFVPQADERKAGEPSGLSYNYSVQADLTDEGGETRSASRTYRVGFVSVEANLNFKRQFYQVSSDLEVSSELHQLDGKPRSGVGQYRIVRLKQPAKTPLPAELPSDRNSSNDVTGLGSSEKYLTGDDKRRGRFETQFSWPKVTAKWADGDIVAKGKITHDTKGSGALKIKAPPGSGVYRLYYETKDDFGAVFKVSQDFLVATKKAQLSLPLLLVPQDNSTSVGGTARVLLHSGLPGQPIVLEQFKGGIRLSRKVITAGVEPSVLEFPITAKDRGGFALVAYALNDYQMLKSEVAVNVPWEDRQLNLEFSTFRDKLRPGGRETFTLTVKGPKGQMLEKGGAEILALMYDRSLDLFAPHHLGDFRGIYPQLTQAVGIHESLGRTNGLHFFGNFKPAPYPPTLINDHVQTFSNYSIGGPGSRRGFGTKSDMMEDAMVASEAPSAPGAMARMAPKEATSNIATAGAGAKRKAEPAERAEEPGQAEAPAQMRSNFSETAFFKPQLLLGANGQVSFEFEAPDSVTSWKVMAQAMTKDLRSGITERQTETVKELMIRPYIPRFLREGDAAEIKVTVNNSSSAILTGEVEFDIIDPDSKKSVLADFGLAKASAKAAFKAPKGGSDTVGFAIKAPKAVGTYAFKVVGKSKNFSDGELRPFPVLPSRMHLAQSRFVTLKNQSKKTLEFKDLAEGKDATLINEKMVVTLDAQLFYGVLQALPYLVSYPYECSEQTLNRFLSTGIMASLFTKYPSVAKMAKELSSRTSQLEKFDEPDANRRMTLEETPWLVQAQGGKADVDSPLVNVLDERVAKAERDRALARLRKMQLSSGAFPWFEGGRPDEYMTLYMLMGFARALEFKVDVPKDMAQNAWKFIRSWLDSELNTMMAHECCWETITLVNYILSSYPDTSWTGDLFDQAYRTKLLNYSFGHWKNHAPLLKGYLALTLHRMDRNPDAKLVWDSVMDSAKTNEELGTYWAPEDRAWLWYNDTIETHAFSLRTLMELQPGDSRNEGLVQWLFLNKKLNHWKSTKATAEVIYSLTKYLDSVAGLSQREVINVDLGNQKSQFTFEPDKYTGKKNQLVIPGEKVDAKANSKITVEKSTPGFAFASATWHFSTDTLPKEGNSDFFAVSRKYFLRENNGKEWVLKPLEEGAKVRIGDQIEVQLSLRTKHEAEYVHLRDPRAAGLEPESQVSSHKWDLGISWYEEVRDSGSNFFFSALPVGEYTFKYRLRANMAGTFRVGPATVQSIYAPEFNAYSAGNNLTILPPTK